MAKPKKVKIKRPNGRPPHEPNETERKHVSGMTAIGFDQERIARVLGIDPTTLRKHYRAELDTAADRANMQVGITHLQMATGGGNWREANFQALQWWEKVRMKWKEQPQEFSGPDGGPIQTQDMSALDLVLGELDRLAARAKAKGGPQETE